MKTSNKYLIIEKVQLDHLNSSLNSPDYVLSQKEKNENLIYQH